MEGRDTVVVLATGYGKSLIYQVPAMLLERPTVVISPLIALMRDQERKLKSLRVPVVRLDSTLRVTSRRQILARMHNNLRAIAFYLMLMDLAALTVTIHFTGGLQSPLLPFFAFHMAIGTIMIPITMPGERALNAERPGKKL